MAYIFVSQVDSIGTRCKSACVQHPICSHAALKDHPTKHCTSQLVKIMAPQKARILPQEMVKMRSYERVFAFFSREGGLDSFLGHTDMAPEKSRNHIRNTLRRCFGDSSTGQEFGRRALATDHAHALRRITDSEKPAKAPLGEMAIRLSELRTLGIGSYEQMEAACCAVTAAFVCALYRQFDKADLRICAFLRSLQRLPQSSTLPQGFITVGDEARALKDGSPEIARVDERLVELSKEHTPDVAVGKVSELLDVLALDHTWHERMDQLEQDVESGALVYYDKLRQRGLALINRGDWVRNDSPRRGSTKKKGQPSSTKDSHMKSPEQKAEIAKSKAAQVIENGDGIEEDRILPSSETPTKVRPSTSKSGTPRQVEESQGIGEVANEDANETPQRKRRRKRTKPKTGTPLQHNEQQSEIDEDEIEELSLPKDKKSEKKRPSETKRKNPRKGRDEPQSEESEDKEEAKEDGVRQSNGMHKQKQRSRRKSATPRRLKVESQVEMDDDDSESQSSLRVPKSSHKKRPRKSKSRTPVKVEDESEEEQKDDESADVLAVMQMNSVSRGRKRRTMMSSDDDERPTERNRRKMNGKTKVRIDGRGLMTSRNVVTPVKRRRFSLDRSDAQRMTEEQLRWIERFAVEDSTQVSMELETIDSLL